MAEDTGPGLTGFHHFSTTVTDVEASVAWYQRLFGMTRVPVTFPHYDCVKRPAMPCCSLSSARG
jgi:glyoxylase I family protein